MSTSENKKKRFCRLSADMIEEISHTKVVYINGGSNSKRQNGKFEIKWF